MRFKPLFALFFASLVASTGCQKSISIEKQGTQSQMHVFEQIKIGMTVQDVEEMTKDFKFSRGGSGFTIDSYTLNDKSVVSVTYKSGRVLFVRHGDKLLVGE